MSDSGEIPCLVSTSNDSDEDGDKVMANVNGININGPGHYIAAGKDDNHNANDDYDDDDCYDDDDDDAWNEMEEINEPAKCLFCADIKIAIEPALKHVEDTHNLNLKTVISKFNMDQYSYIKMINYIRMHNSEPAAIANAAKPLWLDDKYLKPVEVDAWLMFDIEEIKQILTKTNEINTKPDAHIIEDLQSKLQEKDAIIEQLSQQIEKMRDSFRHLIEQTDGQQATSTSNASNSNVVNSMLQKQMRLHTHVAEVAVEDDEAYFSTYAHFDIHHDMLSDTVRTNSYRDAILNNKNLFEGKTVLDVGCGTSILAMFASKAGAKQIIAIDQSEIIYHAIDIANRNNIKNIKFIKGRIEDVKSTIDSSIDKVDIIVSEWMGYFLLFEGMLDSVIYARDHYLKPDGLLLPNRCNISLVGLGDERRHAEYISFWNDVYGFDMSIMQAEVLKEAIVEACKGDCVLTEPVVMAEFNTMTVDYTCPNFVFDFELVIKKDGKLTAFVGYFDTFFDLPNAVHFTTGPHGTSTHWKQVIFYIRTPVSVKMNEVIRGQFQCRRGLKDIRALCIQINVFNQIYNYSLN